MGSYVSSLIVLLECACRIVFLVLFQCMYHFPVLCKIQGCAIGMMM